MTLTGKIQIIKKGNKMGKKRKWNWVRSTKTVRETR